MERNRRKRRAVSIDGRIDAARAKLEKARSRCDRAEARLKSLMDRRDETRRKEIMEAVARSRRSYDEILAFIRG